MSEINATPATEAASSETQDFLSSVGESEKRVRVSGKAVSDEVVLSTKDVNVYYGDHHALKDVNIKIRDKQITSFIGPSGCGKSTLLRCFNRMNDGIKDCRIEGKIALDGQDILGDYDICRLRQRVGMVFQRPNPFPMSIYDNVAYGPCGMGVRDRVVLDLSLIHI